jgi:spore coat polysaccharide biosynthesis protein SpsF
LTAIVLQARLDSVRLPGKAMLPLDKKPVIFRVMEALNNIPADIRVLACPEDSFSTFAPLAKEASFEIFSGPKEDVLERYCQVVRKYSINRVIRATGDNPFIFTDAAAALNNEALALLADYAGYQKLPYGAGIESVAASALLFAAGKAALPFEREHVCPFLYTNENIFKLYRPDAPSKWQYPDFRLTIDDQKD